MDSKNNPRERIYFSNNLSVLPPERSDIQHNIDQSHSLPSTLYQGSHDHIEKQSPIPYDGREVFLMSSKQTFIDPSYDKNRSRKGHKVKAKYSQDSTRHSFGEDEHQRHQMTTRNISCTSNNCYSNAGETFSCGLCLLVYDSICQLHFHMKDQHDVKAYTFDLILGSAFPIAEMKAKWSQTDINDLDVQDFVPIKCELNTYEETEMAGQPNEDIAGVEQLNFESFNETSDFRSQDAEFDSKEIVEKLFHKVRDNSETEVNDQIDYESNKVNVSKTLNSGSNEVSLNSDVDYAPEYETSTDEEIYDYMDNITIKKGNKKKTVNKLPSTKKQKRLGKKTNKQTEKADKKPSTSMLECEMCGTKYNLMSRLKYHMMKVHSKVYDGAPRLCKWCGKSQKGMRSYLAHIRQCEKNENRMCFICQQYFPSKTELMEHLSTHNDDTCYICQKTFRRPIFLHHHLRRHNRTKSVQCEHCGKSFVYQYELTKHLECCNKDPAIECDQCDLKFKTEYALQNHKLVHSDLKPYVCHICGHAAKKASYLVRHIRVHTGEKPYPCSDCDKRFPALTSLYRHRRVHTNNKPYACTYCEKAFNTKWSLKTHLRQHTGDTPYKCELCNKAFKQNVLLKLHYKSHHP